MRVLRPAVSTLVVALSLAGRSSALAESSEYFGIQVVDDQTGRPVPMVELQTTSSVRYYTDSNGLVAFREPGLMDQRVFFGVASHGYECPPDGFGIRGRVLETKPGTTATIKVKRINIAERLYRTTGQGIYRDTVLLGRKAPTTQPLLDAQVTGQDGILNAFYKGKQYWFYGDTLRLSYPLGNFSMTGATSADPAVIDPERNFDLHYFTAKDGFVRAMCPLKGEGVVWLYGVVVLPDPKSGDERMLAYYQRRRGLEATLENGFVQWNDAAEQFEKLKAIPQIDPPLYPTGYPSRIGDYVYFTTPFPTLRVRADYDSYLDPATYESFTCLKPGTFAADAERAQLDRDAGGKLIWGWKRNTGSLSPQVQQALVKSGRLKGEKSPLNLTDVDTKKPIVVNNSSCFWNDYRKKYVLIACQHMGDTVLGEIYYAEADRPEGPWCFAKKIITHANKPNDAHDFYNPTQHPFLDRQGGRVIYLEGSYVNTFSGNPHPTPLYEYNQIMYRLDLGDPRLRLP